LQDYKWRINHYHNRIADLEYKLEQQYDKYDAIKRERELADAWQLQAENMQLRNAINESEGRNRAIRE